MSCYPKEIFIDQNLAKSISCAVCQRVPRDPVSDQCGHTFGRECLKALVSSSGKCPLSKSPLPPESSWIPNYMVINILNKCSVKCPSSDECSWEGRLEALEGHLQSSCQLAKVGCSNKGCGFAVERRLVSQHEAQCDFRRAQCPHCLKELRFFELREHNKSCAPKPVPCPNGCARKVASNTVQTHIDNECPESFVECELAPLGCNHRAKRKYLSKHYADPETKAQHLELSVKSMRQDMKEVKTSIAQIKDQMARLTNEVKGFRQDSASQSSTQMQKIVSQIAEKIDKNSECIAQFSKEIKALRQTNDKIDSNVKQVINKSDELKSMRNQVSIPNEETTDMKQDFDDQPETTGPIFEQRFKKANKIEERVTYENEQTSQIGQNNSMAESKKMQNDFAIKEFQDEAKDDQEIAHQEKAQIDNETKQVANPSKISGLSLLKKTSDRISSLSANANIQLENFETLIDFEQPQIRTTKFSEAYKTDNIMINVESSKEIKTQELRSGYALLEKPVVSKKKYCFKVEGSVPDVKIGVCLKSVLEQNAFKWEIEDLHGTFMFRHDGLYSRHGKISFDFLEDPCVFEAGDVVEMTFDFDTRKLALKNRRTGKISWDILPPIEDLSDLHPCIWIFSDEVFVSLI